MIRCVSMLLLALYLTALLACSGGDAKDKDTKPATKDAKGGSTSAGADAKLEAVSVGDLKVQKFGRFYLGGQPSKSDLAKFKEAGVKTLITLRMEDELKDFKEMEVAAELGMIYNNPGFSSAATLSDPILDRVRSLLSSDQKEPVLLHCASGGRVGAVWLAHRVLDDGIPYNQALEEAKAIGLKSKDLEDRAKKYIDEQKAN